jgi:hypothetical protein
VAVMEEGRDDGVWQKRALHYYSTAYLIDQFAYGRNQFGTVIDVLLYLLCFMTFCLPALLSGVAARFLFHNVIYCLTCLHATQTTTYDLAS